MRVSRRARSTALWVALSSAVLARREGLRLGWALLLGEEDWADWAPSTGGGRARVWTEESEETAVWGPLVSVEEAGIEVA